MRKYVFILFALILFLPSVCFAFKNGDVQYWNTEGVSLKINDAWKATAEEEFRFGDNISRYYYQHTDFGISYSGLADWLVISVNYRMAYTEKETNWNYESRPHVNVTLKYKWNDFAFSNRSRIEYRFKGGKDKSLWRYRNKFTIKVPKFTECQIQPYAADEIFISFKPDKRSGFNRTRFYAGLYFKVSSRTKVNLYYVLQTSEIGKKKWQNYHAFGSKLVFYF